MIKHVGRRGIVGYESVDTRQLAYGHAAARFKLGRVGDYHKLVGARQKLGFGAGNKRVTLDDTLWRN